MTNRKIAPYFIAEVAETRHIVFRDASTNPSNWKITSPEGETQYNLDPSKYVAIKQQVNKINRFYKAEAEDRLTQLFEGLAKRLQEPAGARLSEINYPKKWMK